MVGKIDAHQFAFPGEGFFFVGFLAAEADVLRLNAGCRAEERHLAAVHRFEVTGADGDQLIEGGQQGGALTKRIQRSGLDQVFERALADGFQIHALGEVVQVAEGFFDSVHATASQNQFHRADADIFDGAHAKTNGRMFLAFFVQRVFDAEIQQGMVHVGLQRGDAEGARFGDVERDFGAVVFENRHERAHVFGGVVRFQKGGLYGDEAVIGGVAFVEAVAGELFPVFKNRRGGGFVHHAFVYRAVDEFLFVLGDFLKLFFGNGFAQVVRFGAAVAGDFHCRAHDLFLVDRDAVGVVENWLQRGVTIDNRFFAVHAADVAGDEIHWAGAVERHHGDDVVEVFGFHLDDVARHTRAFQLEDARRFAFAE